MSMIGLILTFLVCVIIVALLGVHAIWKVRVVDKHLMMEAEAKGADRPDEKNRQSTQTVPARVAISVGDVEWKEKNTLARKERSSISSNQDRGSRSAIGFRWKTEEWSAPLTFQGKSDRVEEG